MTRQFFRKLINSILKLYRFLKPIFLYVYNNLLKPFYVTIVYPFSVFCMKHISKTVKALYVDIKDTVRQIYFNFVKYPVYMWFDISQFLCGKSQRLNLTGQDIFWAVFIFFMYNCSFCVTLYYYCTGNPYWYDLWFRSICGGLPIPYVFFVRKDSPEYFDVIYSLYVSDFYLVTSFLHTFIF